MRIRHGILTTAALAACTMISLSGAQQRPALAFGTTRITIDGTSNVHAYTASTATVRVTEAKLVDAVAGPDFWIAILKPGAVQAFDIAIPAATLASVKGDIDKNMHKALKVEQHADITFKLLRLDGMDATAGTGRAIGLLKVAGVEREVTLALKTQRKDAALTVTGTVDLLMTDYGITPPKAMLGMLKTDPKVTVTFATTVMVPLT